MLEKNEIVIDARGRFQQTVKEGLKIGVRILWIAQGEARNRIHSGLQILDLHRDLRGRSTHSIQGASIGVWR